jgi:hypothetical protein
MFTPASYYEKASCIAHEHGSTFFIHACGRQRVNLKLMDSLGVDGLEGVAFPPLGDVQLDEVMQLTSDRFLITGGISAMRKMATVPNFFRQEFMINDVPWRDACLSHPLPIENGYFVLPERPGLGFDLNEAELQKHPGVRKQIPGRNIYV